MPIVIAPTPDIEESKIDKVMDYIPSVVNQNIKKCQGNIARLKFLCFQQVAGIFVSIGVIQFKFPTKLPVKVELAIRETVFEKTKVFDDKIEQLRKEV